MARGKRGSRAGATKQAAKREAAINLAHGLTGEFQPPAGHPAAYDNTGKGSAQSNLILVANAGVMSDHHAEESYGSDSYLRVARSAIGNRKLLRRSLTDTQSRRTSDPTFTSLGQMVKRQLVTVDPATGKKIKSANVVRIMGRDYAVVGKMVETTDERFSVDKTGLNLLRTTKTDKFSGKAAYFKIVDTKGRVKDTTYDDTPIAQDVTVKVTDVAGNVDIDDPSNEEYND